MNKLKALLILARPQFCLEPTLRVILNACLYAHDHKTSLNWTALTLSITLICFINIALNYYNDYDDYEGDLINAKRSDSVATGGAGILVNGILPRWSALAGACFFTTLCILLIVIDQYFLTTPTLKNETLVFGLLNMAIASQYNGYLRLAYTPLSELTTTVTYSLGVSMFAYNTQAPDGKLSISWAAASVAILDAILQFSRVLTMMVVDTEADHRVGKMTLACTVGVGRCAIIYRGVQWALVFASAYFTYVVPGMVERWMVMTFAAVTLPQTFGVAKQLDRLAKGDDKAAENAPFVVSMIMVQETVAMWGVLLGARGILGR